MKEILDPPTIAIRPLDQAAEAEECARLMASSEPWLTLRRSYDACLKIVSDTSKEVYVAFVGGRLVGFLIINMKGAFVGYIQTICVRPDSQGQGFGSCLVRWAESRIFRESPNVFMCVSSFNHSAYKLYERLGYTVVGELKDYLVRGHSEVLLRKSIAPLGEFRAP